MSERPGFNVGQLRAALGNLPDDMEVTVRAESKDGEMVVGGILTASTETDHHEGGEFFCIDASDDLEEFDDTLLDELAKRGAK